MKTKAIVLLFCSILPVGIIAAPKESQPTSVHYELTLKSSSFGNMGTRKMWIQGGNMRWESKSAQLPLRLIRNKDGVFLLHPWRKMAAKYPAGSDRANPQILFPGPVGPVKDFLKQVNARKIASDTLSGKRCDVYSYSAPVSKRMVKLWIDVKSNKPIKLYLKGERKKVDTITAMYTRFELGTKVNSSLFKVPSGYEIKSMPKPQLTSKTAKPIFKKPG